ncbi:MAG: hypothetical protein V4755_16155, partial [Curtobacterium sp.]
MSTAIEPAPRIDRSRSADVPRASRAVATRPKRRDWPLIGLWIGLVVAAIIWIVPFVFMFITSVKSQADIANLAPWALPTHWEWGNYTDAAQVGNIWVSGANSLIIAVIKVPLGLLLAAMAAFA